MSHCDQESEASRGTQVISDPTPRGSSTGFMDCANKSQNVG
jgi:hypothetical protein